METQVTETMFRETYDYARQIIEEVRKVIMDKDEVIVKMLTAILAGGHILIEDVPGVGKTTLALAFSRAMDLACKRLQFTPDVMPSDVVGFTMYNKLTQSLSLSREPPSATSFWRMKSTAPPRKPSRHCSS